MTGEPGPSTAHVDRLIGAQLRDLRRSLGLRQADFAERLGKDRSTVSKYERGERQLSLSDLLEIATRLEYPPLPLLLKLLPPSAFPPGLDEIVTQLMREPALITAVRLGLRQDATASKQ
jgi:transcriptional regulator with XRE-family HTH domain